VKSAHLEPTVQTQRARTSANRVTARVPPPRDALVAGPTSA